MVEGCRTRSAIGPPTAMGAATHRRAEPLTGFLLYFDFDATVSKHHRA
jgi:hypothetical protein